MKTRMLAVVMVVVALVGVCAASELEGRRMTAKEMKAAAAWLEDVACYEFVMEGTMSSLGFSAAYLVANRALADGFSNSRLGMMGMEFETLCDGDSLWTFNHTMKTYTVEPWLGVNAPRQGPLAAAGEMTPPFAFDILVDMLTPSAKPGQEEEFYTFVGEDTVVVAGIATACEMWAIAPDTTTAIRVWVDPVRHIALKNEAATRTPTGLMTASATFTRLEIDHGLTPASFVFTAPEGYRRVAAADKLSVKDSLEGETPPDFTLTTLGGDDVSTRDWRGKVVLLDYWGTHCPPCVREFGHLQDLRAEYGDDVVMVAVTDDAPAKVERFIQQHGLTLPVWLDARGEVRDAYRVSAIPALYILDAEGKVREHFVGEQKPETLREAMRRLGVAPRGG